MVADSLIRAASGLPSDRGRAASCRVSAAFSVSVRTHAHSALSRSSVFWTIGCPGEAMCPEERCT
jgi:hypothetical protein